ncbi:MAG TPA: peptidylprolyl isomerase [Rhodanobacteraceae bacterium]|nr:peptidylprolyl isomerase [Rhodanobacteraceae bacterium]
MKVEQNKVVSFHYSVSDGSGETVDSSRERGEPLTILAGHGNIIPGLEKALEGRGVGDAFQVTVPAAEAYGARNEDMVQRVPKKYFQQGDRLKPGDVTVLALKDGGHRVVTVQKVGMTAIDVDLNHPMAGKDLSFDVEITQIRDASEEEIAHGHVHGPGGHSH